MIDRSQQNWPDTVSIETTNVIPYSPELVIKNTAMLAPGLGLKYLAVIESHIAPAELHHIPSQECNVENLARVRRTCQYYPMSGFKRHLILIDEGDQMSNAAQTAMLSMTDSTNRPPNTLIVVTCNGTDRLEPRFLSRFMPLEFSNYGISSEVVALLESIWNKEAPKDAKRPDMARLVKNSCNNVRAALMALDVELMTA